MNHKELIDLVHSTKDIIIDKDMAHSVTVNGAADYVTKVDFAVQEYLRRELAQKSPEARLLSEEQENRDLTPDGSYWVLDPIDGTTNLIHDYQMSAVSLGLYENRQMVQAVVYNPFTEETFHAVRGQGAWLDGVPIKVSHRDAFDTCIISFGSSPYEKEKADTLFPIFRNIFIHTADFRRSASAALDLCYVAAGRVDGFLEYNLKAWDYAAASLIIEEAGGRITDWNARPVSCLANSCILAATPEIYEELRSFLPR